MSIAPNRRTHNEFGRSEPVMMKNIIKTGESFTSKKDLNAWLYRGKRTAWVLSMAA
jgi:hypothetical protein